MRLIRNIDTTLRDFVLGRLDEQPRLEIEERLVTDPEVFAALGAAEQELAEAYLEGTLSAAEKKGFERHYMIDPRHHTHVDVIRLLKVHAVRSARTTAPAVSDWRRLAELFRLHPAWTAAAASVVLLLIGGNLTFMLWNYRLQDQSDQVREHVAGLTSLVASLQTRLESQQAVPGQTPPFVLTAGQLRSIGPTARIEVPPGARVVRLQLQLQGERASSYKAVLADADGIDLWFQAKLAATSIDGRDAVMILLPAELLPRGDYQVKLNGISAGGDPMLVATYTFRVTTP
jgi:hypothetical protein